MISPGGAYGRNGEGFFRISLTTPDDRLTEAVDRLGCAGELARVNGRSGAPRQAARVAHRLAQSSRAETSPSSRSCCAPPASRSSATLVQQREQPHPNSYLGSGKLDELKALAAELDANVIACDDELSPRQERNARRRRSASPSSTARRSSSTSSPATPAAPRASCRSSLRSSSTTSRGCGACGPTSSASAAASARADRARPRSRPTAAWRATASRRCAGACATCTSSRQVMRTRARALGAAADRARRLHQRRQVVAAERVDRGRGAGRGPPLPHARPDDARRLRSTAAPT